MASSGTTSGVSDPTSKASDLLASLSQDLGGPVAVAATVLDDSPFAVYLAAYQSVFESAPDESDEQAERYNAVEADLQACMAAAGFEYYPIRYEDIVTETQPTLIPGQVDLMYVPVLADDRSVVEQYGYGLTEVSDPTIDLMDQEASKIDNATAPNDTYRASLSEQARAEYDLAMGLPVDADDEMTGCQASAHQAHPEPTSSYLLFDDAYYGLVAGMMKIQLFEVGDDPRVVQAGADWNQCMLRAGVDVSEWIWDQDQVAFGHYASPWVAISMAEYVQPDGSQWEEGDLWGLQASEPQVRIALADFDCRVETDYEARVLAV
ncbi:MAG: hypothetical protein LBR19_01510, partial [Bifidobacteriaceae bacterium]|nr:hypothetical protein [Bifidobacteriaceae bacterium]